MEVSKIAQAAVVIAALGMSSCTSSTTATPAESGTTYTNTISTAVSELNEKISGVTGVLDASVRRRSQSMLRNDFHIMSSFAGAWLTTTPGIDNPVTQGAPDLITFQDYMGQQLDADLLGDGGQAMNAFGRMNQAFQIFCAVGVGSTIEGYDLDSQGYLANGTYTFTFTSTVKTAMTSTCGIDTGNIPDDTVMTLTVATGGANYDKVLTFDAFEQKYMVKNDSTVFRVATSENTSNGYSRTIAEYNKSTLVTRAQAVYINGPSQNSSVEVFRIYYDETADEGMVLGYMGNDMGVTGGTRYLLAGKPSTGDAFSLSLRSDDEFADTNSYEACVLSADGTIETDGSRCTASSTRLAGADVSTANGIITTFYSTYSGQAAATDWGKDGLSDTDVLNFTDETDLATAALTDL